MNEEYEVKTIVGLVKSQVYMECYGCYFDPELCSDSPSDPCRLCGDKIFVMRHELVRIK